MRPHKFHTEFLVVSLIFLIGGVITGCSVNATRIPFPPTQTLDSAVRKLPTNTPPATPVPKVEDEIDPWSEEAEEVIEWGEEITIEKVIELAKSKNLFEIQWHVMPNVVRILMQDGTIYHYKNANIGIDIEKTLNEAGINTRQGGISLRYSFCN